MSNNKAPGERSFWLLRLALAEAAAAGGEKAHAHIDAAWRCATITAGSVNQERHQCAKLVERALRARLRLQATEATNISLDFRCF